LIAHVLRGFRRLSNDKHNPNVELIGQGIANIVSPLFGGLRPEQSHAPHHVRSDAKPPIAGIVFIRLLCWGLFCLLRLSEKCAVIGLGPPFLMIVAYQHAIGRRFPRF